MKRPDGAWTPADVEATAAKILPLADDIIASSQRTPDNLLIFLKARAEAKAQGLAEVVERIDRRIAALFDAWEDRPAPSEAASVPVPGMEMWGSAWASVDYARQEVRAGLSAASLTAGLFIHGFWPTISVMQCPAVQMLHDGLYAEFFAAMLPDASPDFHADCVRLAKERADAAHSSGRSTSHS